MSYGKLDSVDRRVVVKGLAGAAAGLAFGAETLASAKPAIAAEDAGEVAVLGWSVYWSPEMIGLFKEKTGITVRMIGASTDQEMFTKLQTGGTGDYDVVHANAGWTPLYHRSGLIEPISLDEVKGSRDHLYHAFTSEGSQPYVLEPDKTLLFYPNMWSPFALLWRKDIHPSTADVSWALMWDDKIPAGSVIFQGGAGDDFLALAGLVDGVPKDKLYAMDQDELDNAIDALRRLKPFQILTGLPDVDERFRTEKASVGMVGELGLAARINEALGEEIVATAIPKEGALGWVDGAMLLKGAKNRANAIKLMEFMASDPDYLRLMFEGNSAGLCSRTGTEAILATGGKDAATIKEIQGDRPELASELIMTRPPVDPAAYSAAWDRVLTA